MGGEGSLGDRGTMSSLGELFRELGGVKREPPRRTWQVGQILTKREISSLGTLTYVNGVSLSPIDASLYHE